MKLNELDRMACEGTVPLSPFPRSIATSQRVTAVDNASLGHARNPSRPDAIQRRTCPLTNAFSPEMNRGSGGFAGLNAGVGWESSYLRPAEEVTRGPAELVAKGTREIGCGAVANGIGHLRNGYSPLD